MPLMHGPKLRAEASAICTAIKPEHILGFTETKTGTHQQGSIFLTGIVDTALGEIEVKLVLAHTSQNADLPWLDAHWFHLTSADVYDDDVVEPEVFRLAGTLTMAADNNRSLRLTFEEAVALQERFRQIEDDYEQRVLLPMVQEVLATLPQTKFVIQPTYITHWHVAWSNTGNVVALFLDVPDSPVAVRITAYRWSNEFSLGYSVTCGVEVTATGGYLIARARGDDEHAKQMLDFICANDQAPEDLGRVRDFVKPSLY